MPVVGYNGPSFNTRLGDRNGMSRPESRPGRDSDLYQETETHDEFGRRKEFVGTGWKTGGDRIEYKNSKGSPPTMAEIAAANNRGRSRATHSSIGALITYGGSDNFLPSKQGTPSAQSPSPQKSAKAAVNLMLSTDESTMPGDLLVRKSGLPIAKRMAALIRQRSLDMYLLINDYLQRTPASKMGPQRGHAFIDIATFRRALCYAFGEQWTILGMTTAELVETYSPYISRQQNACGDTLLNWKAFCTDISEKAGVRKGNQGYLLGEADFSDRISIANQEELERDDLKSVMDQLFSHDIETEEEKQQEVLKDVERVTGARSIAVTRYGSYESRLHGRNSMGVIKQGEFERIGVSEDRDRQFREMQGTSADGSHMKAVNAQVSSQSHEYAADGTTEGATSGGMPTYDAKAAASASPYDAEKQRSLSGGGGGGGGGARLEADRALARSAAHNSSTRHERAFNTETTDEATAKAHAQAMKAQRFQQMMHAKFGREVESQLQADDYDDADERTSVGYDPSQQRVATSTAAAVDSRGKPIALRGANKVVAKGLTPAQLELMQQRQRMTAAEFNKQQLRRR